MGRFRGVQNACWQLQQRLLCSSVVLGGIKGELRLPNPLVTLGQDLALHYLSAYSLLLYALVAPNVREVTSAVFLARICRLIKRTQESPCL